MHKLHLSPEAIHDLEEIRDYITEELQNPEAALKTIGGITKRLRMFWFMLTAFSITSATINPYLLLTSQSNNSKNIPFLTVGKQPAFFLAQKSKGGLEWPMFPYLKT